MCMYARSKVARVPTVLRSTQYGVIVGVEHQRLFRARGREKDAGPLDYTAEVR